MTHSDSCWKKCNTCKKPIAYRALYWVCNVSTCNRLRTGLSFCTVSCWDAHLPDMNHREAWAEERTAPGPGEEPAPVTRKKSEMVETQSEPVRSHAPAKPILRRSK